MSRFAARLAALQELQRRSLAEEELEAAAAAAAAYAEAERQFLAELQGNSLRLSCFDGSAERPFGLPQEPPS